MAEPQAVPASGEAAPLPSLEPALDAALRERCAAAGFPDFFISHGAASYGAEKGSLCAGSLSFLPACTHSGPGASAATLPPLRWLLSITVRFSQVPQTASMAATAACSLAAAAAAVAALLSRQARLRRRRQPRASASEQRHVAAARGGRRARRRWQADRHPASVSAWAVVCEPHGACQRRAGPPPSGMSVRYLATSVLRASRRCQSRAEKAVAEAEDAARDGRPGKPFG